MQFYGGGFKALRLRIQNVPGVIGFLGIRVWDGELQFFIGAGLVLQHLG